MVEIRCTGLSATQVRTLEQRGYKCAQQGTSLLLTVEGGKRTQELIRTIIEWGGDLHAVVPRHASLEEVYLAALQTPEAPGFNDPQTVDSKQQHVEEVS